MSWRTRLHRVWWLLQRAFVATYEDGCLGMAKGAAYSALLSFLPVLTAAATILVQVKADAVSRVISRFLFEVVPPGAEELVEYGFAVRGERPVSLLVLATLVSLWAASGVMASLMEGFQAAYKLPSGRSMVHGRAVAILLVIVAALPAFLASALIVFGGRTEQWVLEWTGVIPRGELLRGWISLVSQLARLALALGAIVLGTSLLYYLGPSKRRRWRDVLPGSLLATGLWLAATTAFAWYVRNIANYNVLYGSIGAVIALLVWMYVLSVIALVGCEYNAEREKLRRSEEAQ